MVRNRNLVPTKVKSRVFKQVQVAPSAYSCSKSSYVSMSFFSLGISPHHVRGDQQEAPTVSLL